jgi:hypothetical protein
MSGNDPQIANSQRAWLVYYEPTLWRSALYAVIAGVVFAPAAVLLEAIANPPGRPESWIVAAVFLSGAAFLSQFLCARFKVDERGISRRILMWWDLWPWTAFAEGKVRETTDPYRFEFPERPIWRRSLNLELVGHEHADTVIQLILLVWKRPPQIAIPESATFRQTWPNGRTVTLSVSGIAVNRKRTSQQFAWSDISKAAIWRSVRHQRNFDSVEINLPGLQLNLLRNPGPNWTGATAEEIIGILRRHVSAPRLQDFTLYGAPCSIEEVDARQARELKQTESARKELPRIVWFVWMCKGAAVLFVGAGFGAGIGAYALMMSGIAFVTRREIDRKSAVYDAQRAVLRGAVPETGDSGDWPDHESAPTLETGAA